MRLYNIYYLCKNSIGPIMELDGTANTANTVYILNGWREAKDCFEAVSKISFFSNYVDEIFGIIPTYQFKKVKPELSCADYRLFMSKKRTARSKVRCNSGIISINGCRRIKRRG